MNQLRAWLSMGGYSLYVWSAYGLVFMVLAMNFFDMKSKSKQIRKTLQQWFKR